MLGSASIRALLALPNALSTAGAFLSSSAATASSSAREAFLSASSSPPDDYNWAFLCSSSSICDLISSEAHRTSSIQFL